MRWLAPDLSGKNLVFLPRLQNRFFNPPITQPPGEGDGVWPFPDWVIASTICR